MATPCLLVYCPCLCNILTQIFQGFKKKLRSFKRNPQPNFSKPSCCLTFSTMTYYASSCHLVTFHSIASSILFSKGLGMSASGSNSETASCHNKQSIKDLGGHLWLGSSCGRTYMWREVRSEWAITSWARTKQVILLMWSYYMLTKMESRLLLDNSKWIRNMYAHGAIKMNSCIKTNSAQQYNMWLGTWIFEAYSIQQIWCPSASVTRISNALDMI